MQKRVLSRMVWHKTCTFCIHSKKIFSARRLTRHTVQEGTSLGPRIQRLDINHRMIILTLDNDPQMTGYVPWISVTRWGTETELSGFAMFSHGSHNAWLKCQGHSANWTLARQKWVAGYLLGYSLKFVWYIHVYTINIYSHASPQINQHDTHDASTYSSLYGYVNGISPNHTFAPPVSWSTKMNPLWRCFSC
jgi:hypothetical protein